MVFYSVFSRYSHGDKDAQNNQLMAYVGTQADKQEEAMSAMIDLLNNMPESEQNFENAKTAILKKIESQRITRTSLFFNYLSAERKGLKSDIRESIYQKIKAMEFDQLKMFHEKYVKDRQYNIAVIGDRSKLNFAALGKYGNVKELSLEDIFGYKDKEEMF